MELVSNLIDAGTLTKKIIVQDLAKKKESGWLACIIGGVVLEKFMYFTPHGDRYIQHNSTDYIVDTPLKPVQATYNRSELVGYY